MKYYLQVIKDKYATFSGRARRAEYWYFTLFHVIISFVLGFIDGILFQRQVISALYGLAVIIPGIAVAVRRMHDVGKSGWFILIPFYNLILACTEGDKGANEYGPDPKGAIESSYSATI
ncbi:DUF805 domain-containing protein [Hymenobacter weizhouensis]|uniref:DUF805 domain-containing protein n=1 Tax=Hymenobacter sp. YIM 151500-1 TaxID=2987689 RepID=UPI0022279621|nr:DUF805 domain-containing protein [Hymenobacter sp. YIM 151500-1]UYZ64188.1 DUF805 domain-containing protein [Hymenobacter sp. YIM 151500-1]